MHQYAKFGQDIFFQYRDEFSLLKHKQTEIGRKQSGIGLHITMMKMLSDVSICPECVAYNMKTTGFISKKCWQWWSMTMTELDSLLYYQKSASQKVYKLIWSLNESLSLEVFSNT